VTAFESLPLRERVRLLLPYAARDPEVAAELAAVNATLEANPLLAFEPHSPAQRDFIEARTRIVAAFAGNRFGKSTALICCALREALDRDQLPACLRGSKRFDPPTQGWIVCPTEDKIFDPGGLKETFEKWCPRSALKGGNWRKAFNGERMTISFENGSSLAFKTYKQDPSDLGGAALHWVGYDEPPPRKHREECRMRTADYGGFEMFAMTPLKTNTGYVRREIFKKREAPNVTVVRGSIHDNPTLNKEAVADILGDLSDLWRRAREFGDFVDVGGQIYPDFERCVVGEPWAGEFVRSLQVVVGIDPGIRNAGVVWVGFDRDNVAYVFDEELLQDSTPAQYAAAIKATNARWGLKRVLYVVDPAARARGQTNAETVQNALIQQGVPALPGQNDVETGIGQVRTRMEHGRFWVSPVCRGLRDEADEYAAKEPDEGKDDSHLEPIKSNDHRLDALRYACMERFWDPVFEMVKPRQALGWSPASGTTPPKGLLLARPPGEYGPIGAY
jgi:phage terminase large subunit-like protein